LILTAARRTEVGGMKWSEVVGDLFILPASRSKNARPHEVPLVPLAVMQLPTRTAGRDLVFGSGGQGSTAWSPGKARLDRRSGVTGWGLHDLRRTASTFLAEHDVEPSTIDAVLNHARAGVRGVYVRALLRPQKRVALTLWAEYIGRIVEMDTGNITALG